jgi:putative ubiquitin-RnfH superfamily antitoxin RatB of RatAB toxin-antitoxin module
MKFMTDPKMLAIEVAYATPAKQTIIKLTVESGSTLETAIERSGILEVYPEIDLQLQKVGVFSKIKVLSYKVHEGDRIEIYRPLVIDPKEARRNRAKPQ